MTQTERRDRWIERFVKYCKTTHGPNPITSEALQNLAYVWPYFESALQTVGGRVSSGYRSSTINKIVGGARNSRHMTGLAIDIIPQASMSVEQASLALWKAAGEESLGLVQQVIWEPSWVHVGWYSPVERDNGMNYLKNTGPNKYVTIAMVVPH